MVKVYDYLEFDFYCQHFCAFIVNITSTFYKCNDELYVF